MSKTAFLIDKGILVDIGIGVSEPKRWILKAGLVARLANNIPVVSCIIHLFKKQAVKITHVRRIK